MVKLAKAKVDPTIEFFDEVEQGSEEWFALRRGIPTASVFSTIMADGKDGGESVGRRRLLYGLAGELLSGEPRETYENAQMRRGKEMEAEAREKYRGSTFEPVHRVGFVRRTLPSGRYVGASPDSLVGHDRRKGLEIKTMMPELMIERLVKGAGMPPEHRAQLHGTMWVAGLDAIDLVLFYRGMPVAPRFPVTRDDAYVREISNAVEIFDHELHKLVQRIRAMG